MSGLTCFSYKPFMFLWSCFCLLFSSNKLSLDPTVLWVIFTPHWISWLCVQHSLLIIIEGDVLVMGFWLNISSALGLVRIPAVKNMLEELMREHVLGLCVGFLCACMDGDRGPLPLILLRSSHLWVFFRLMRHLQQAAAFFPALCCSCPLQSLSTN